MIIPDLFVGRGIILVLEVDCIKYDKIKNPIDGSKVQTDFWVFLLQLLDEFVSADPPDAVHFYLNVQLLISSTSEFNLNSHVLSKHCHFSSYPHSK